MTDLDAATATPSPLRRHRRNQSRKRSDPVIGEYSGVGSRAWFERCEQRFHVAMMAAHPELRPIYDALSDRRSATVEGKP